MNITDGRDLWEEKSPSHRDIYIEQMLCNKTMLSVWLLVKECGKRHDRATIDSQVSSMFLSPQKFFVSTELSSNFWKWSWQQLSVIADTLFACLCSIHCQWTWCASEGFYCIGRVLLSAYKNPHWGGPVKYLADCCALVCNLSWRTIN